MPEKKELLDQHLLNYLASYQDFLTCQAELQAALRDGHIALAHARRELSRTRNSSSSTVSPAQFPREFQAQLTVRSDHADDSVDDTTDGLPTLSAMLKGPEARLNLADKGIVASSRGEDTSGGGAASTIAAVADINWAETLQPTGARADAAVDMQGMRDALGRLGVASDLQGEIASSLVDDGGGVAMMHGNRLVVSGGDFSTCDCDVQVRRLAFSFQASGL